MKGFSIKTSSQDRKAIVLEVALKFSSFDAFVSLKVLDNFLPHCLVDYGSACFGGEQEVAFIWIYRAVKSYNVIRRRKFIRSKVFSVRISAAHFEHESISAQRFDQNAF